MVRKCCFCKATASKNIKLHSFPSVDESRQVWIDAVPIKMRCYRTTSLCSRHFRNEDYKLGRSGRPFLCSSAVPSVFLLSDLPDLNEMKSDTTRDPLNLNSANSDTGTTSDADSESTVDTESTITAISESFELPRKHPEKFSLKGKPLDEKSMVMLMNVLDYFHRTSDVGETILVERTAFACGVSVATVYRTKARFKAAEEAGTALSVPRKRYIPPKKCVPRNKRVRRKKAKLDIRDSPKQLEGDDIENCIGEYCTVKEEITEYKVTDFSTGASFVDTENFVKVEPLTVSVIKQEDNLY